MYLKNIKQSVIFDLKLFPELYRSKIMYILNRSKSRFTLDDDKMLTVDSRVALDILDYIYETEKPVTEASVEITDKTSEMFGKTGTIVDQYGNFYVIKIGDEEYVYPENKLKMLKD